jgi:hypothetical protein
MIDAKSVSSLLKKSAKYWVAKSGTRKLIRLHVPSNTQRMAKAVHTASSWPFLKRLTVQLTAQMMLSNRFVGARGLQWMNGWRSTASRLSNATVLERLSPVDVN